jgi:hypothetical protein
MRGMRLFLLLLLGGIRGLWGRAGEELKWME